MSKVKRIEVLHLKAIDQLSADLQGCTAIITGRNNAGKSSFLRSLPDRFRGSKPDVILKEGEHNGFAEWTLTTGERLRWEFEDKTKAGEKLIYITEKELKVSVTQALRDKFFPPTFDVDAFLQAPPMKQRKTLQELVGLDFTDIDKRYKDAFEDRQNKNRSAYDSNTRFTGQPIPDKVDKPNLDTLHLERDSERNRLTALYTVNKKANDEALNTWERQCDELRKEYTAKQQAEVDTRHAYNTAYDAMARLTSVGYTGKEVQIFIDSIKDRIIPTGEIQLPDRPEPPDPMPSRAGLDTIEQQITAAQDKIQQHAAYERWLKDKQQNEDLQKEANDADVKVKAIEKERMDLIKSATMPDGFTFSDDGILYNGLAFTREQQSSSGLYIASLKLALMKIGEVRCLHFDASFLDKKNLMEVEQWAQEQDLQLLIERPSFEDEDISYEIIEK